MLNKILLYVFAVLLLAIYSSLISAQPHGDEPEKIRRMVNAVQDEITEVDKRIVNNQSDANLYAERGKLYVKLYRTLYFTPYLSGFYWNKPKELNPTTISTKAIEDFNKAIKAKPNAELLKLRGEMYAIRWFDFDSLRDWRVEIEKLWNEKIPKIGGQEWNAIIAQILREDSKREEQIAVLQKFLGNSDFDNARKDLRKSLKISTDSDLTEEINEDLGRLLMTRIALLHNKLRIYDYYYYLAIKWTDLIPPNQLDYSILDDLNQGILYLKNSNPNKNHESGDIIRHTFYTNFYYSVLLELEKLPSLKEALFLKAVIAFNLEKNKIALETLNEAEKLIDHKASGDFTCELYSLRSRVYSRMKNYDAALADANKIFADSGKYVCYSVYEPRGDAYFGKGNFKAAIEDYASQLSPLWSKGFILNVDEAEIYKKIRTAFLKLNDKKSAINYSISYQSSHRQTSLEETKRNIEILKIRSHLYQEIGEEKKALEDKSMLDKAIEYQTYYESLRSVYGKVLIPDNGKINATDISVKLVSDKTVISSLFKSLNSFTVNRLGQFYFTKLNNEPFYLYFYFDKIEKNIPVRYYWKSQKFERGNKIFGPLVITLDKFKRLDSKKIEE